MTNDQQENSILLTKIGSAPYLFGVVEELRKFLPTVRILGIESSEDVVGHPFDSCVANSSQLLLGSYPSVPESNRFLPPLIYRKFEKDLGHLLRLADRVFAHDLVSYTGDNDSNLEIRDTYSLRLSLVMRHAIYWNHILDKFNTRAIVFPNLPHGMWDTVLLSLSKSRDIPYMYFHEVPPFRGTLYLYEGSSQIGNFEFGRRVLSAAEQRFGLINNSHGRMETLWKQAKSVGVEQGPSAPTSFKGGAKRLGVLLKEPRRVRKIYGALKRRRRSLSSQREEQSVHLSGDMGEGFFFLELQLPGNATTLIKGRDYPRQIDLIRYVAASIPSKSRLVVRESPRFYKRKLVRPENFWTEVNRIPGVQVVGTHHSPNEVSARAAVVVELSYSSLAHLHLLSGKPVVFLTDTHLGKMPNLFSLQNFASLTEALEVAMKSAVTESQWTTDSHLQAHISELSSATIETALSWYPDVDSRDPEYRARLSRNVAGVVAAWFMDQHPREVVATEQVNSSG